MAQMFADVTWLFDEMFPFLFFFQNLQLKNTNILANCRMFLTWFVYFTFRFLDIYLIGFISGGPWLL